MEWHPNGIPTHTTPRLLQQLTSCVEKMAACGGEASPTPQPIETRPAPTMREGYFQGCEGYLKRKSKILKRWKLEWLKVEPGKLFLRN